MNILQVFNGFSGRWNANGYYCLTLARALQDLGHKLICVGDPGSRFIDEARKLELEVVELKVDTNNPLDYFRIRKQIGRIIRDEEIDLINCHRGMVMAAYLKAARASGRTVRVIRTHGEDRWPRAHALARREMRKLDGIICTTEAMAAYYRDTCGTAPDRLAAVYGGVAHAIHRERAAGAGGERPDADLVIGMLGRISDVKGHAVLIKALGRVIQETGRTTVLRIAGGGDPARREAWLELAHELEIPESSLDILGGIHFEDVPAFIRSIDLGIIPSLRSEMICRVLMEFTAFDKPVFGSQVNAVGEAIENFGLGLTSPPGDSEALAANIITALTGPQQMKTWAANSRKAYEEHFNPESFARATLAFYQRRT